MPQGETRGVTNKQFYRWIGEEMSDEVLGVLDRLDALEKKLGSPPDVPGLSEVSAFARIDDMSDVVNGFNVANDRRFQALERREGIQSPTVRAREDDHFPSSEGAAKDPFMTGDVPEVTPRNKEEMVAAILELKDSTARIVPSDSSLSEPLRDLQLALTKLLRLVEEQ